MKLLFVQNSLALGGTETLVLRMSKWLSQSGHSVMVVAGKSGPLAKPLQEFATVKVLGQPLGSCGHRNLSKLFPADQMKKDLLCPEIIFTFDAEPFRVGVLTKSCFDCWGQTKSKLLSGIFHPRSFALAADPARNLRARLLLCLLRAAQNDPNVFYESSIVKEYNAAYMRSAFVDGPVWHLPVVESTSFSPRQSFDRLKIISVGRLTSFKTYNLTFFKSLQKVRARGFPVVWHIYGRGELEPQMRERITQLGLQGFVHLHGDIPYEQFRGEVITAGLFVGEGTALAEAAGLGVPCIPMLKYTETPVSHGHFWQLPEVNQGEWDKKLPTVQADQLVADVLNASDAEYLEISRKTHAQSQLYSMNTCMNHFISLCDRATTDFRHPKRTVSYAALLRYWDRLRSIRNRMRSVRT